MTNIRTLEHSKDEQMTSIGFHSIVRLLDCSIVYHSAILHFIFLFPFFLFAQQKMVQYDRDFVFKDGIYLSFLNFKMNAPVGSSKIISNYNRNSRDFFDKILSKNTFTYADSSGNEQTVKCADIWGYCQNGTIYINHGTDYNRVTIIGNICHFVATIAVSTGGADPFYYNDPFGNPYPRYTYMSEQFILDFETGKILEFNVTNIEMLLGRDETLYKEFSSLTKKQKRNSIFIYLRKYNEKHPVYFPE